MSRILRVFPRRTKATPTDGLAFVGNPPLFHPEADEIRVSVTFTWDREEGERLADAWTVTGLPVSLGGPAYESRGEAFTPGLYLRPGYVITSRGCPNHCWFCAVPQRDGILRELPIADGWIVQDDNLLACSHEHIRAVGEMLSRQPFAPELRGLEAKQMTPWHAEWIAGLRPRPRSLYFAYDTPDDLEPLRVAGQLLREAGFAANGGHDVLAYVLIGYPGDTFDAAETRLYDTWRAGFFPFAMLYRDRQGDTKLAWRRFQRVWARAAFASARLAEMAKDPRYRTRP